MVKVSVLIPCYNHQEFVSQTINSVMNQTFDDFELIVIDDGSKDNSVSIIRNLQKEFKFKFISRPNKGLVPTVNELIGLSSGDYYTIFASDDVMLPNRLERQVSFLDSNPGFAMCHSGCEWIDEKGEFIKTDCKINPTGYVFPELLKGDFIIAPSVMIRKSVLEDVGKYDESLQIEDYDMFLRIAHKYPIGYLNEVLVQYRQHPDNSYNNPVKFKLMNENVYKILSKWKNTEFYSVSMHDHYFQSFKRFSKTKFHESTIYYGLLSWRKMNHRIYWGLWKNVLMNKK